MEHRWGERFALHLTVQLSCTTLPPVAGSLEDVSASGAFVRMAARRPPRGPVEVMLQRRGSGRSYLVRLPAYVVRETEAGVGIEWCEFAPPAVRELMVRGRRASAPRARRSRALSPSRRSSRATNMTKTGPATIDTGVLPATATATEWSGGVGDRGVPETRAP